MSEQLADQAKALRQFTDGVVLMSCTDWLGSRQRPHHLAERFARAVPTWFVETTGLRSVSLRDLPRAWGRFRRAFPARSVTQTPAGLEVVHPRFIPLQASAWAGRLNGAWVSGQIRARLTQAGVHRPLVIVTLPGPVAQAAATVPGCVAVVYDCMDEYPLFHQDSERIHQAEFKLLGSADLVVGSSQSLVDRLADHHPLVRLVRNGVDATHFSPGGPVTPPAELDAGSGPVAGYFGTVASWFDTELLSRLATSVPSWRFVVVGPITLPPGSLPRNPNIHWLGPRPYAALPGIGRSFDVCLIPFKINEITRSVDPIKVYEYLALGKPVISTPLPELQQLGSWIHVAASAEQFATALTHVSRDAGFREHAMIVSDQVRRVHSWDARWEMMVEYLVGTISQLPPRTIGCAELGGGSVGS